LRSWADKHRRGPRNRRTKDKEIRMTPLQPRRYRTPSGPEAQFQPGSHRRVLVNRLGIARKTDMDKAEYQALVSAQTAFLKRISDTTRFTAALNCTMHRQWLGGIYDWAGNYRTVELAKGDFRWPPAYLVPQNMAAFEKGFLRRNTPCRPGPLHEVSRRIAEVHAELLLIHPFREGNGRLARWLADLMALQAGLPVPEYSLSGRGSRANNQRYLEAVKKGYVQDYADLTAWFIQAFERRLRKER